MYRKNAWKKYDASKEKEVMKFESGYISIIYKSKKERLEVKYANK